MTFNDEEESKATFNNRDLIQSKDHILTSPIRFPIMLVLYIQTKVRFSELQKLLHISSGNLDHHIKRLEMANYVIKRRIFFLKRPQVVLIITNQGRDAFKDYTDRLRDILSEIK